MDSGHRHVGRFQYQVAELYVGDQEQPDEIRVSILPDGERLIQAFGDVDLLTAPALDRAVEETLVTRPRVLILDLSNVTFLASAGLATLMHAQDGCYAAGAVLRLVSTQYQVLRPMELTGLIQLFDVYPDIKSALHSRVSEARG